MNYEDNKHKVKTMIIKRSIKKQNNLYNKYRKYCKKMTNKNREFVSYLEFLANQKK